MSRHTPGPWRIGKTTAIGDIEIVGSNDERIHYAYDVCLVREDDRQPGGHKEANALMISACPEMYEALKGITDAWLRIYPARIEIVNKCLEAIAKAEGREK